MSVSRGQCLLPPSSLPPVRSLRLANESTIDTALRNLHQIYCPLRLPASFVQQNKPPKFLAPTPLLADSGYASRDEDDDAEDSDAVETLDLLRADQFERSVAVRWLTALIARAEELCGIEEDTRSRIIEEAAFILSSFTDSIDEGTDHALSREFSFSTSLGGCGSAMNSIHIRLNDAPLSTTDHTDVGLQSWGASIILSSMMCASPERFELENLPPDTTVIELGAGTGLVSLTLAALLPRLPIKDPRIIATDYHSAVLENLRSNMAANSVPQETTPVQTMVLDWSNPPSLSAPANMLVAADVVYAPEHAAMLLDCAARLLAPGGIFWLIVTVRNSGKFEGIAETVEAAMADDAMQNGRNGRNLKIFAKERLDKRKDVGRGDESGYILYRIGLAGDAVESI
ncbi:S-adenosyl-L-methionine-dependent methyltransferase [Clohesyomyces aquaticus]|uniref:S-adenosyl-L-methionine-dependent methyltransferase n=1 Tax=Clohesyomyces aquaticus TaxID=1231657 RepID=A0A1Y1ZT60_9PLEO|nr:S-adenosyl-L-methionine-dependent methyltransferase [Clohesyomyces aquaticus]